MLNLLIYEQNNLVLSDLYNYLPYDILTKLDRASMYSSLEARSPFLDHRIAEFVCPLPWEYKLREGINNTQNKWILRKILYKYVPRNFVDRPKKGFSFPLQKWLRQDLKNWANEHIYENNYEFINKKNIIKKWEEHKSGERNWHYQIWTYLMFSSWHSKWI